MISNNAKLAFNHMFTIGFKASMLASPDDLYEITTLPNLAQAEESNVVILTISSFLFRLTVLIYFTPDETTKAYYATLNKMECGELSESDLIDVICERSNMCAGALNRELATVFPHSGMSTPNIIDSKCSSFLNTADYGHLQQFEIAINQSYRFNAAICVKAYADLDFSLTSIETESTGELELF